MGYENPSTDMDEDGELLMGPDSPFDGDGSPAPVFGGSTVDEDKVEKPRKRLVKKRKAVALKEGEKGSGSGGKEKRRKSSSSSSSKVDRSGGKASRSEDEINQLFNGECASHDIFLSFFGSRCSLMMDRPSTAYAGNKTKMLCTIFNNICFCNMEPAFQLFFYS